MTNKEKMDILKDIVVIVDSREKKNDHITTWLDENKIPYVVEKLKSGDYSFFLKNYPELEVDRKFTIEKKNSLDELAGNFTKDRERFAREFERVEDGEQIHLVIENATFKKLLAGTYRSSFNPKAYLASLVTYCIRYNVPVWFTTPDNTGEIIYSILYYELYEYLNHWEGSLNE